MKRLWVYNCMCGVLSMHILMCMHSSEPSIAMLPQPLYSLHLITFPLYLCVHYTHFECQKKEMFLFNPKLQLHWKERSTVPPPPTPPPCHHREKDNIWNWITSAGSIHDPCTDHKLHMGKDVHSSESTYAFCTFAKTRSYVQRIHVLGYSCAQILVNLWRLGLGPTGVISSPSDSFPLSLFLDYSLDLSSSADCPKEGKHFPCRFP